MEERPPARVLRGRNLLKADVLFYDPPPLAVALKTYADRPGWVQRLFARRWVLREAQIYRRLEALDGIPQLLGLGEGLSLVTERVPGLPLRDWTPGRLSVGAFDRLDDLLQRMHKFGVAHGDLHHRDVLFAEDERLWLVDFVTAISLGDRPGRWRRWRFDWACRMDHIAACRMRCRALGLDEKETLEKADLPGLAVWKAGRRLKSFWNRLRGR